MPASSPKVNQHSFVPGRVLVAARHAACLNQRAVAEQIKCSRQTLVSWENDEKRPIPSLLAAYLRCLQERGVTVRMEGAHWIIQVDCLPLSSPE